MSPSRDSCFKVRGKSRRAMRQPWLVSQACGRRRFAIDSDWRLAMFIRQSMLEKLLFVEVLWMTDSVALVSLRDVRQSP